jgi:hypothetical protein
VLSGVFGGRGGAVAAVPAARRAEDGGGRPRPERTRTGRSEESGSPTPRLPGGTLDLSGVEGSYFGSTTRITERFRRITYGRLELDVTVEDPKAYTRPWTVRINYRLVPDQQLIEFVCNENEQSSKHYLTK